MRSSVYLILACLLLGLLGMAEQRNRPAQVSIQNLSYSPATVTIEAGQSVTWTNDSDSDHTVDAQDGSFSSGKIRSGGSYTQVFRQPGTYAYGCKYHPRMKGRVVVK